MYDAEPTARLQGHSRRLSRMNKKLESNIGPAVKRGETIHVVIDILSVSLDAYRVWLFFKP